MNKFFRKIRQNLITEIKTTKHIKYTIGEMKLVVIGILKICPVRDNLWVEKYIALASVPLGTPYDILYLKAQLQHRKFNLLPR